MWRGSGVSLRHLPYSTTSCTPGLYNEVGMAFCSIRSLTQKSYNTSVCVYKSEMDSVIKIVITLTALVTQMTIAEAFHVQESGDKSCGDKPADIVFALDASSSIWGPDFQRQLEFVQELITIFTINEDAVRIGMMTFSDDPHDQFNLGTYESEAMVSQAVGKTPQALGGTRTDLALHAMHKEYFHDRHARQGVVHIGIVITDGQSHDPRKTAEQAEYAREAGIYLFAVGVGQGVDKQELRRIASSPSDQFVFMVENYSALNSIKELLAIQTCKVTEPPTIPTTLPPTTTTTPPPADQGCGDSIPADVVFALPPKISEEDGASALRFVKEMSFDFDIAYDKVRVALVPQECSALRGFSFDAAKNQLELDQLLMPPHPLRPTTVGVLRYMRRMVDNKEHLPPRSLDREIAKNVGVIIIDCNSPHPSLTAKEALQAKRQSGMELFVVTVGKTVTEDEANIIASEPLNTHVFSVTDYEDLHSIRERLVESINDSCHGEFKRRMAVE